MGEPRPHVRFAFPVALALILVFLPGVSQAQPDPRCSEPGVTIMTDVTGDALTMDAHDDIERISIAQPLGPDKIMFILKVVSMAAPLPPDHSWPVVIGPLPAVVGQTFVTRLSNFPNPLTPTFSAAPGSTVNPVLNPGTPADPASNFTADGTIRIVVARSQIGNPAPGSTLSLFSSRVRIHGGAADLTPDNLPDDLAPSGSYQLITSETCVTNRPPVAVDDTATTVNGFPVTINVKANDSDPDGDMLDVVAVTDPPNGTAILNADDTVTYTPACPVVQGNDTFTYTVSDGKGGTDTGLVTVRNRKTSRRGSIDPCGGES